MKLEIQTVGNPKFPRYIIANSDGEVFDGTGWNKDRGQAVLFSEGQAVAVQFNALQESLFEKHPLREFTVPLNVRVRAGGRFTQKELEEYLERAVSILIDQEKGTGPVDNSMVQLQVTWGDMREQSAAKDTEKPSRSV